VSTDRPNDPKPVKPFEELSREELIELVGALKEVVQVLQGENAKLRERVGELERWLGMNSQNSSKPPSSDAPWAPKPPASRPDSDRKQGGQPGHPGHCRKLIPVEQVTRLEKIKPVRCPDCGRELVGEDSHPERRQVWDLPEVRPEVTEYQRHTLGCPHCGRSVMPEWPGGVPAGSFGPQVIALVALLTGCCHMSRRMARQVIDTLYGLDLSLGSVAAAEELVSKALAQPVEACRQYVQSQPAVHVDETGWYQKSKVVWLWVMATAQVASFQITKSRGREALRGILGGFEGRLITDRWSAYNAYDLLKRQLCWAHLIRAFRAFLEGAPGAPPVGEGLLAATKKMFQWWHRIRDGTIDRATFQREMEPLKHQIEDLLLEGTRCGHAPTQRTCKRILKVAPALWTFVHVEGVEPTNNAAERAVRQAVLWRKCCFGSQSDGGCRFAERVLTISATMKLQQHNALQYIRDVCMAHSQGQPAPSPLPMRA
jgi:transposase